MHTQGDIEAFHLIGWICIVFGVVFALFGDRKLPENGVFRTRFSFVWNGQGKSLRWLKWVMGAGLIYAGINFLLVA